MKRWLEAAATAILSLPPKPNKGEEHLQYLERKEQEDERLEVARTWLHEYAIYACAHRPLPSPLVKAAARIQVFVDARQAQKTATPPVERTGRKRSTRPVAEA